MKFLKVFFLFCLVSTAVNADLSVTYGKSPSNPDMDAIQQGMIDFGNVCIYEPASYWVYVTSLSGGISDGAITLSGNQKEMSISNLTCPSDLSYCSFTIDLEPQNNGSKRKKLTIDYVKDQNDISLTIPVIATTNNPSSANDSSCWKDRP